MKNIYKNRFDHIENQNKEYLININHKENQIKILI